jgi:hypothetical protein
MQPSRKRPGSTTGLLQAKYDGDGQAPNKAPAYLVLKSEKVTESVSAVWGVI